MAWKVSIPKDQFDKIRSDSRLPEILRLGRVINSLIHSVEPLLNSAGDAPAKMRQNLNSFLFTCGVLHEALSFAGKLEKHFRDVDAFRNGFGKLLKDRETKKLRDGLLKSFRNKVVFHYDDFATNILKNIDWPEYVFVSGTDGKWMGAYYNLSDELAINFILEKHYAAQDLETAFRSAVADIGDLINKYVESADLLTTEILQEMNWVFPDPSEVE